MNCTLNSISYIDLNLTDSQGMLSVASSDANFYDVILIFTQANPTVHSVNNLSSIPKW